MSEDAARDEIARRLRHIGYEVESVPEGDMETADLCARHGTGPLLVEVKSRTDDEALHQQIREDPEQPAWDSQSINWTSAIDDRLGDARRQLRETPDEFQGICGVWFIPAPRRGISATPEQVRGTLLGIRQVLGAGAPPTAECYYATQTGFWKYEEIAFAIVESELLVNEFCPQSETFRESHLYQSFSGSVCDLARFESTPESPIIRGDHKRTDEAASMAALQELHPECEFIRFFDLQMIRGFNQISHEEDS